MPWLKNSKYRPIDPDTIDDPVPLDKRFMHTPLKGQKLNVLVVDDNPAIAEQQADLVRALGHKAEIETKPQVVIKRIASSIDLDLVLLDYRLRSLGQGPLNGPTPLNGLTILREISRLRPEIIVIMATVINDTPDVVQAIKHGAYNYLVKPLDLHKLGTIIDNVIDAHPRCLNSDRRFARYITRSHKMNLVFNRTLRFATAEVPVLIEGETGTGKDVLAEIIHNCSPRSHETYNPINISAISPELFASELFGHKKGSFSSAYSDHEGHFHAARKGTILLDEIGDLDPANQTKLLRVIQNKEYYRIGDTEARPLEARLIMATNRVLKQDAESGDFRSDLFYRLGTYTISLPPLRERPEDIALLADYFFKKYCSQFGRPLSKIADDTLEILKGHDYPGNIRELENILSCAVLIEQAATLTPESLPRELQNSWADGLSPEERQRFKEMRQALQATNGNRTKAAEIIGIARQTFQSWIKKYRDRGFVL